MCSWSWISCLDPPGFWLSSSRSWLPFWKLLCLGEFTVVCSCLRLLLCRRFLHIELSVAPFRLTLVPGLWGPLTNSWAIGRIRLLLLILQYLSSLLLSYFCSVIVCWMNHLCHWLPWFYCFVLFSCYLLFLCVIVWSSSSVLHPDTMYCLISWLGSLLWVSSCFEVGLLLLFSWYLPRIANF